MRLTRIWDRMKMRDSRRTECTPRGCSAEHEEEGMRRTARSVCNCRHLALHCGRGEAGRAPLAYTLFITALLVAAWSERSVVLCCQLCACPPRNLVLRGGCKAPADGDQGQHRCSPSSQQANFSSAVGTADALYVLSNSVSALRSRVHLAMEGMPPTEIDISNSPIGERIRTAFAATAQQISFLAAAGNDASGNGDACGYDSPGLSRAAAAARGRCRAEWIDGNGTAYVCGKWASFGSTTARHPRFCKRHAPAGFMSRFLIFIHDFPWSISMHVKVLVLPMLDY